MKIILNVGLVNVIFFFNLHSQTPGLNKTIKVWVSVNESLPSVNLHWLPVSGASSYVVHRKTPQATTWGSPVASGLSSFVTTWTDNNITLGEHYEYRITAQGTNAIGYIRSGVRSNMADNRGILLLVYDSVSTAGLNFEINRWIEDVEGDGWFVERIPVSEMQTPVEVKNLILSQWNNDPQNVKALFLLGRVPIPYSGNMAPDGHTPDHEGAWPADGYYAELNGNWTDLSVNNTGAAQNRQHNIPGDGKFDQNIFPSPLELQIGRVDFRNLPAFGIPEAHLLKKYLDKNHAFRNKKFSVTHRALVDDEFTSYSEGFSVSGWRSFFPIFGTQAAQSGNYQSDMSGQSYLWSYGCGAGSYTNCSGVISSNALVNDSLGTIFTMVFGSYFGDWDSPSNNLLRMVIASGATLTNCWSGRPFWYFHPMGMGETVGHCAWVSMNNSNTYDYNIFSRGVFMALMGDPTLRAHILKPVENLTAWRDNKHVNLNWSPSPDAALGYNIYRRHQNQKSWYKINHQPLLDTIYQDSCLAQEGIYVYMVRGLRLEETFSGTYINMSSGKQDTVYYPFSDMVEASFDYTIVNQQGQNQILITNQSSNATDYNWLVFDGNTGHIIMEYNEESPSPILVSNTIIKVILIVSNECFSDTAEIIINIPSAGNFPAQEQTKLWINPNPSSNYLNITIQSGVISEIQCYDVSGRLILKRKCSESHSAILDITSFKSGIYMILVESEGKRYWSKVIKK